jgi:DMSO reductase anchor subunit
LWKCTPNLLSVEEIAYFYGYSGFIALVFLIAALIASMFHLGHPERAWRAIRQWRTSWLSRGFLIMVFPVPLVLLTIGLIFDLGTAFVLAAIVQYVGLIAERWFFFAQARHLQNIYYQAT